MASQENATASVMPLAGKLARAMAIVLLVGIPVTVLFIVLVWYGAEESCLFGVHAGLHLVSLVGPVLGVCAVVSAARNRRAIAALVGSEQGDRVTRRLALWFLVASSLLVVAGSADSIVMVEGGARMAREDEIVEALEFAHGHIKQIVDVIESAMKGRG